MSSKSVKLTVFLLALLIGSNVVIIGQWVYQSHKYVGVYDDIRQDLAHLATHPPAGVNDKGWEDLIEWCLNVFAQSTAPPAPPYSRYNRPSSYSTYEQLEAFRDDFRQMQADGQLQTRQDLERLVNRIEKAGPNASKCAIRFRPEFERIAEWTFKQQADSP